MQDLPPFPSSILSFSSSRLQGARLGTDGLLNLLCAASLLRVAIAHIVKPGSAEELGMK
jgi:hypothetical protein